MTVEHFIRLGRSVNRPKELAIKELVSSFHRKTTMPLYPTVGEQREIEEIRFTLKNGVNHIQLNRSKALNALNSSMVSRLSKELQGFEASSISRVLLISAADANSFFCAGGDLKEITFSKTPEEAAGFFRSEYELNHAIATCKKPVVAILNGVTLGGGAGLSIHAQFTVVTEKAQLGMPECSIGFFPDVGSTFFLSRLGFAYGRYLGLTGRRIGAVEMLHLGLASHFIPSERIPALELDIQAAAKSDACVKTALDFASAEYPPVDKERFLLCQRLFSGGSLEQTVQALRSDPSEFAKGALAAMQSACPSSLQLTWDLLERAKSLSFQQSLQLEHRVARNLLLHSSGITNLQRGVYARLVDRTKSPEWVSLSLEPILKESDGVRLHLPPGVDFQQYPWQGKTKFPTHEVILQSLGADKFSKCQSIEELAHSIGSCFEPIPHLAMHLQEILPIIVKRHPNGGWRSMSARL